MNESIRWSCKTRVEKYLDEDHYKNNDPYEVKDVIGNTAFYTGLNLMWNLVSGKGDDVSYYFLNSNNTYIGVGNSAAKADADQTGLLGSSTFYKNLDQSSGVSYPIIDENRITFRAKFDINEANFAWNEWGILNGNPSNPGTRNPSTIIQMNRKVEPMGTKEAGNLWVIVCDITLNPV